MIARIERPLAILGASCIAATTTLVGYCILLTLQPERGRQDTCSHPQVRDGILGDVDRYGFCQVVESENYAQPGVTA
jgi:hypothetical protein